MFLATVTIVGLLGELLLVKIPLALMRQPVRLEYRQNAIQNEVNVTLLRGLQWHYILEHFC